MKTMMNVLTNIEELESKLNSNQITILVFSADWCPDCMFIKPFLPKLISKYNHYSFLYVDSSMHPRLVKEYEVMGIPSFIAIKEGKEINRFVSKLRKTESEIDTFLGDLAC